MFATDGRPIERVVLDRMGDSIAHRGPDGCGTFVEDGRPAVGLLNRRLAVIDLEGGSQPITVEDGAFTIVYNGELFNTAELRRELEAAGHRFVSNCDTEVVVRGYAQWGPSVLDRLDGMWAFAIWDAKAQRLFLARDRLGIKPLVYAAMDGVFVFASEIKALVASGLVSGQLDPTALPHYLSSFAVPDPLTLFDGVRRLPAGHALLLTADDLREYEYWDCAVTEEADIGFTAYREEVDHLLEESVVKTMVSDVPLGVLLSGGVDSRLLATYAARHVPGLKTFTLGFDDPRRDERPAARLIAERLGTEHHEDIMDARAGAASLRSLVEAYDEPGQSLIQTHFVSQFARRDVTVALSGLGGDELFSGYPTHVATNVLAQVDALPGPLHAAVTKGGHLSPWHRFRRLSELAAMDPDERVTHKLFHQTTSELRSELLAPAVAAEVDLDGPITYLVEHLSQARSLEPLNRVLYLYIKTYLPNELLRATDAMSMLSSLEVRVPFLSHQLVERAMAIPARHKMRLTKGKLLLHEIARHNLAVDTTRMKRGFSPPLATWLQGELGTEVADLLSPDAVRRRGLFNPEAVGQVVRRCLAGEERLIPAVMMLYSFEVWARRWLDSSPGLQSPDQPLPPTIQTRDPDLSVIIVNWNTEDLTRAALQSLRTHLSSVSHEVIVVDNNSGDGSAEMVEREFPDVQLIRNSENVGFGRANNQAMRLARGSWFLLFNSDAEIVDGSVAKLFHRIQAERSIGVAHCRLVSPDGSMQYTTYRFPSIKLVLMDNLGLHRFLPGVSRDDLLGGYWDQSYERDVDWVAGAFMLLRREVFEETGGFDETIFMYGEDLEWCQRIRDRAWRIRYFPEATVLHQDHASSDILWGEKRVAVCLKGQQDIVAARAGSTYATAFAMVQLVGALTRLTYYSVRGRGSGDGGKRYRVMIPYQRLVIRNLFKLLRGDL